jgi:hypothetical protein
MFGFLKKLFGGDPETNKEAGVQIEQVAAPYKVPEPVPVVDKVAEVNAKPIEKTSVAKPKTSTPKVSKPKAEKPKAAPAKAKKPKAKKDA